MELGDGHMEAFFGPTVHLTGVVEQRADAPRQFRNPVCTRIVRSHLRKDSRIAKEVVLVSLLESRERRVQVPARQKQFDRSPASAHSRYRLFNGVIRGSPAVLRQQFLKRCSIARANDRYPIDRLPARQVTEDSVLDLG